MKLNKPFSFLKNEAGMTLVELLISAGLVGLIVLGASSTSFFITKETKDLQTLLEMNIDNLASGEYLKRIVENAGVSLNKMSLLDNNGKRFFDYYHDLPDKAIPAADRSRQFTLSRDGRPLILIVNNYERGSPIIYQVRDAYRILSEPTNPLENGGIAFDSVDRNNRVSSQRPDFWNVGQFLMLEAPYPLRPLGPNGLVNIESVPRNLFFVGQVADATSLSRPGPDDLRDSIDQSNPRNSSHLVSNPNHFFLAIPIEAGKSPTVIVSSVDFYRISVGPSSALSSDNSLYVERHVGGVWAERIELVKKINRVEFKRPSVSRPIISFEVIQ